MAMKSVWILVLALAGLPAPNNKPAELLKRVKMSLPEAMEKAAPEAKDCSVFAAQLREIKGRPIYYVGFAKGDSSIRISLDAATAEVVMKTTDQKNNSKAISVAKLSMAKAIEAAVKKVEG